ncbi:DUF1127 domain-containing protein [Aliishimia ponticola]|nr:DUF1127 domain-containing protein [Aliishimia ponticola]
MAYTHTNQAHGFHFGSAVMRLFGEAKKAYARQAAYSRTYRELSEMSDHELDDIGLTRGMIHDIAFQASRSDVNQG